MPQHAQKMRIERYRKYAHNMAACINQCKATLEANMPIVNAKALVEARKRKGWTQLELSEATRPHQINVSTISRLERGTSSRVRESTLRKLGQVLGVTPTTLCSAKEPDRDIVKLSLDAAARNALTLVALRYRIHRERIIEVAPLLFFIAAEACLRDRQKRVDELHAAADAMVSLQSRIQHLPRHWPLDDEAVSSEERSIKKRDLFAACVLEDADRFRRDLDDEFDEEVHNPFVVYLRNALESIGASEDEVDALKWSPSNWPRYKICADQAKRIVGNDAQAVQAILSGTAALHEMPKASPEERAAWARAEEERKIGDLDAWLEEEMGQTSTDETASAAGSSEEAAP